MGAKTDAKELELVLNDAVDQNQVGFDMAVAKSCKFALERMVAKGGSEGALGAKKVNDGRNLVGIFAAPDGEFEVAGESSHENLDF